MGKKVTTFFQKSFAFFPIILSLCLRNGISEVVSPREAGSLKMCWNYGTLQENPLPARGIDSPVPRDSAQIELARRAYFAQLPHIDCQINRLIHAINEQNLFDNTLFLFISDHGEMLYDHNLVAKGVGYDASTRIPFLPRLPGNWGPPPVSRVDAPVELRDVLPTFLSAAGIPIPDTIEGTSVLPWCRGLRPDWREYIHGEHYAGEKSSHWITNGKEMYIWYSQSGTEQYFDLKEDPCNMRNLSQERIKEVAVLREKLIAELDGREGGYVQNGKLVIGRPPQYLLKQCIKKGI